MLAMHVINVQIYKWVGHSGGAYCGPEVAGGSERRELDHTTRSLLVLGYRLAHGEEGRFGGEAEALFEMWVSDVMRFAPCDAARINE